MKLKFIGDGTKYKTKIICAETGEELVGVTGFIIQAEIDKPPTCTISLYNFEIDMLAELPEEERPLD